MDTVKKMWAAYCEAAGGVTYDGKPLPTWEELGDDRQKCWMAAGKEVTAEIERLREDKAELLKALTDLWAVSHWADNPYEMDAAKLAIAKATEGEK